MPQELTQEYLKECLDYNPDTGIFVWKTRPTEHFKTTKGARIFNSKFSGKIAGGFDIKNYVVIGFLGEYYKAHRLAWLYFYGFMPENDIDHINGEKDDNRLANLRDATRSENRCWYISFINRSL